MICVCSSSLECWLILKSRLGFHNGTCQKFTFPHECSSICIYWALNIPGIVLGAWFISSHFILTTIFCTGCRYFSNEDNETKKIDIITQIIYWVITKSRFKSRSISLPRLSCVSSITAFCYQGPEIIEGQRRSELHPHPPTHTLLWGKTTGTNLRLPHGWCALWGEW